MDRIKIHKCEGERYSNFNYSENGEILERLCVSQIVELPIRDRFEQQLEPWQLSHVRELPLVVIYCLNSGRYVLVRGLRLLREAENQKIGRMRCLTLFAVMRHEDAIPFRLMHVFGGPEPFHVLEQARALAGIMAMQPPLWDDVLQDGSNIAELLSECLPLYSGRISILVTFCRYLGLSRVKDLYYLLKRIGEDLTIDQIDEANLNFAKQGARSKEIKKKIRELSRKTLDNDQIRAELQGEIFNWAIFESSNLACTRSKCPDEEMARRQVADMMANVIPAEFYDFNPEKRIDILAAHEGYMRMTHD